MAKRRDCEADIMINEIKRMFCKHVWKKIDQTDLLIGYLSRKYACSKCGAVEEVFRSEDKEWRFKQEYKGARIDDEENID